MTRRERSRDQSAPPRRRLLSHPAFKAVMAVLSVLCAAPSDCGGGGGLAANNYAVPDQTTTALSASQVNTILRQAANEATIRSAPATIVVVDRLGNVLAAAQMTGAPANATITSNAGVTTGLENTVVPSTLAAISKAITGAFLSSGGNAFSTRTANEIIQTHFPLGFNGLPAGPLFGVQFSQLLCSDFSQGLTGGAPSAGPQHSPLGLAADPGGLPLYVGGVLVGGIGVMSTTSYSLNPSLTLTDNNDEGIALAGAVGFDAPVQIQAQNIAVNGTNLDYVGPSTVHQPGVAAVTPPTLVSVPGFFTSAVAQAGLTYGTPAAGIFPDATLGGAASYPANLDAYVFGTGAAANRYPPTAGTSPAGVNAITAAEAQELIASALTVAEAARAGIRIPSSTHAQVTVSVVDLDGNVLAMARTPDAPVFGADVSLQKARSAVFFSRGDAMSAFNELNALATAAPSSPTGKFSYYANAVSVNAPTLFSSGTAFSELSIGALARPFLPDGNDDEGNGPLSLPIASWSIFSTGLQVDLIKADLVTILGGGAAPASGCGGTVGLPANSKGKTQLANGLQIFSGGYPIYRNGVLVGGIGVSGDGVQQDALIAYLGLQGDASVGALGAGSLGNAPAAIRADNPARISLTPQVGSQPFTPLYVTCPPAPFLESREQAPCD
ncbi:MAG TPA: heme-binding protein [Stellaceae bacterium]|nr:heme-binding protein [Stellaceae bacterium]